jgi:hypothetical protein
MAGPSELFAEFYGLQLSDLWQRWFDLTDLSLLLPGSFCHPVPVDLLCNHCPTSIWAGLMQPDTLPLLGNGYGDWICVRINQQNSLGELIHWYHGGGDWIPVGSSISQAIVHDAIDSFRPKQKQMLRGAAESTQAYLSRSPEGFSLRDFTSLLSERLGDSNSAILAQDAWQILHDRGYVSVVEHLVNCQLAADASIGDLIEHYLNQALTDFSTPLSELPAEIWQTIGELCRSVTERRSDLGWSYALSGLSQQYAGQVESARETFFASRMASAFSDQSVRFRTHRFKQRYAKFSIAQLASENFQLLEVQAADPYLNLILNCPPNQLIQSVQCYWEDRASQAESLGDHHAAYEYWYRAGWDLGVVQLSDYHKILESMARSAQAAGWHGRAKVASIHLNCL